MLPGELCENCEKKPYKKITLDDVKLCGECYKELELDTIDREPFAKIIVIDGRQLLAYLTHDSDNDRTGIRFIFSYLGLEISLVIDFDGDDQRKTAKEYLDKLNEETGREFIKKVTASLNLRSS